MWQSSEVHCCKRLVIIYFSNNSNTENGNNIEIDKCQNFSRKLHTDNKKKKSENQLFIDKNKYERRIEERNEQEIGEIAEP